MYIVRVYDDLIFAAHTPYSRTTPPIPFNPRIRVSGECMMAFQKISAVAVLLFSINGSLHAAEIPKFKAADADGSGFVEETEFAPAQEAGVKESFAELDKDGDGKLSKEEYAVVLGEDCE